MTIFSRHIAITILLGLAASSVAKADEKVYRSTLRSTVWVVTPKSSGTGFVVDREKRLIATNYHVIRDYYNVAVIFPETRNGEMMVSRDFYKKNAKTLAVKARVITSDPKRDLAILQVERLPKDVVAIKLAAKNASPGQRVHSIGNPGASDALWIYTSGTVRQVYTKNIKMRTGFTVSAKVVEPQSPINPGDSGGPVGNNAGELVAISRSFRTGTRLVSSCIAVSELKELLKDSNKTMDLHVQKIIDELKLSYTISVRGNVRVIQKTTNGKSQSIYISNTRKKFANLEFRDVYVTAYVYTKSVPSDVSTMLLERTGRSLLAAWQIRTVNSRKYIVYSAKIAANADSKTMGQLLKAMSASAQDMATRIRNMESNRTSATNDPARSLIGKWAVKSRKAATTQPAIQLELKADKSFTYHIGTSITLTGRYALVGDRLTLSIGTNTLLYGKVAWSTGNVFQLISDRDPIHVPQTACGQQSHR